MQYTRLLHGGCLTVEAAAGKRRVELAVGAADGRGAENTRIWCRPSAELSPEPG